MSYRNNLNATTLPAVSYLTALARYRHLCFNLVGSDLRARFRRSRLGIIWAVIQPLGYSLVIAFTWAVVLRYESYWEFTMYLFSGLVVWEYFATVTSTSMDTLMRSGGYLRQARIPLLVFQLRPPLTTMAVAVFGTIGVFVMLLILGRMPEPGLHLLGVPIALAALFVFSIPLAVLMSIVGAQFRDANHIVQLSLHALFFLSPIMLPKEVLDQPNLQLLNTLNPLSPLIQLFRDPIINGVWIQQTDLISVGIWTLVLALCAILASSVYGRRIIFLLS